MNRSELIAVHAANLLVIGTGIIYAVMRYLLEPVDEWAVVNHPWQPHLQHLHVLAAPALVFAVGLIWSSHVVTKLRNGRRARWSGLILVAGFAPMAVSGYAIQVTIGESWRAAWIVIHLVSSGMWIIAFVFHLVRTLIARRREPVGENQPVDIDLAA